MDFNASLTIGKCASMHEGNPAIVSSMSIRAPISQFECIESPSYEAQAEQLDFTFIDAVIQQYSNRLTMSLMTFRSVSAGINKYQFVVK